MTRSERPLIEVHHLLAKSRARARQTSVVEEEISDLISLADVGWRQGELARAREYLSDIWELVERGPYPLFEADALNVLAQIERQEGNLEAAVKAATRAYELAWCDGPPYAYHWGLQAARRQLLELAAPIPERAPSIR